MRGMRLVALACGLALATGCASLFGSHQKDITMNTNPAGAEVFVNGNRVGVTPLTYKVSNHKPAVITFRMAGFKDQTCTLQPSTRGGWVILDILGGLAPLIVDAATGNWNQLTESACNHTLSPETQAQSPAAAPATPATPAAAPAPATPTTPGSR